MRKHLHTLEEAITPAKSNLGLGQRIRNKFDSKNSLDSFLSLSIDINSMIDFGKNQEIDIRVDKAFDTLYYNFSEYPLSDYGSNISLNGKSKREVIKILKSIFKKYKNNSFLTIFIDNYTLGYSNKNISEEEFYDLPIILDSGEEISLETIIKSQKVFEDTIMVTYGKPVRGERTSDYGDIYCDDGEIEIQVFNYFDRNFYFFKKTCDESEFRSEGSDWNTYICIVPLINETIVNENHMKPLYTYQEALQLTESLIDQDTKFKREVEALISTEEAKDILIHAYDAGDDSAKASIAAATEEQFLDKYAPDGSAKDKDEKKDEDGGGEEAPADDDFLDDATGLEDAPEPSEGDSADADGSDNDDQDNDQDIVDDGGSEDDQGQDTGIDSDNIFAQATSGDDDGTLTDTGGGDNSGNPFLESKKPKGQHSLNESRAAARKAKAKRSSLKRMNEAVDVDQIASEIDEEYYGKIWKFLEARTAKLPSAREKTLYVRKVMTKPEVAMSLAQKMVLKNGIDLSKYGKDGLAQFARVVKSVAGDQWDMGEF